MCSGCSNDGPIDGGMESEALHLHFCVMCTGEIECSIEPCIVPHGTLCDGCRTKLCMEECAIKDVPYQPMNPQEIADLAASVDRQLTEAQAMDVMRRNRIEGAVAEMLAETAKPKRAA